MSFEWAIYGIIVIGAIAFIIGIKLMHDENKPEAGIPFLLMTFAAATVAACVAIGKFMALVALAIWSFIVWLWGEL